MSEFVVNESGSRQLCENINNNLNAITSIISEIDSNDGNLRAALGEDYDSVAKAISMMKAELGNAYSELMVILNCMNDYLERVKQAHESLK